VTSFTDINFPTLYELEGHLISLPSNLTLNIARLLTTPMIPHNAVCW